MGEQIFDLTDAQAENVAIVLLIVSIIALLVVIITAIIVRNKLKKKEPGVRKGGSKYDLEYKRSVNENGLYSGGQSAYGNYSIGLKPASTIQNSHQNNTFKVKGTTASQETQVGTNTYEHLKIANTFKRNGNNVYDNPDDIMNGKSYEIGQDCVQITSDSSVCIEGPEYENPSAISASDE